MVRSSGVDHERCACSELTPCDVKLGKPQPRVGSKKIKESHNSRREPVAKSNRRARLSESGSSGRRSPSEKDAETRESLRTQSGEGIEDEKVDPLLHDRDGSFALDHGGAPARRGQRTGHALTRAADQDRLHAARRGVACDPVEINAQGKPNTGPCRSETMRRCVTSPSISVSGGPGSPSATTSPGSPRPGG